MRRSRMVVTAAVAALLVALPSGATAHEAQYTPEQQSIIDQLAPQLDEYDVPLDKRDALIDAYVVRGELWESLTGGEPVSVETRELDTETQVIQRFSDGSVLVNSQQRAVPASSTTSRAIDNCTISAVGGGSTVYRGCRVNASAIIVSGSFLADWTSTTGANPAAIITRANTPNMTVVGGNWTSRAVTTPKPEWDPLAPARARMDAVVAITQDIVTTDAWLELYVWPDTYTSDSNFSFIDEIETR